MTVNALLQLGLYLAVLTACVKPLGQYMANVYSGRVSWLEALLGPLERLLYRLAGTDRTVEMTWRHYAGCVLIFSFLGFAATYGLQRAQALLPLNPQGLPGASPDSSFNTAVSFATNTNWQG